MALGGSFGSNSSVKAVGLEPLTPSGRPSMYKFFFSGCDFQHLLPDSPGPLPLPLKCGDQHYGHEGYAQSRKLNAPL